MYVQEFLVREGQQERLRQAERGRTASHVSELRRLERRRERAERRLARAWNRAQQLRSLISGG
jgi:hypothetical protein